jgi:excisionase family DNA binding protein
MKRIDVQAEAKLLSVKQSATWLGCSVANVYALIASGALAVVQVGARKGYRVDRCDLEAFVQQRKFCLQRAEPPPPQKPLKHLKL